MGPPTQIRTEEGILGSRDLSGIALLLNEHLSWKTQQSSLISVFGTSNNIPSGLILSAVLQLWLFWIKINPTKVAV